MIVKFKSIKNWKNHIYYLFKKKKHQNQEIIGNSFFDNFNKNQQIIDSYHLDKNGRRSRILSIVVSFKKGTSKSDAESRFKKVYLFFYKFVNQTHYLGLNNDELKDLVNQIPFVFHGKKSNPIIIAF